MPLEAGQSLGPYEIIEPIGKGGMGEVNRARDTKLERDVAIKVLPEAFANDEQRLARFEREAKLLASMTTPTSSRSIPWRRNGTFTSSPWSWCRARPWQS